MTQKAARFYGAKKLFVEDVPLPTIKPQCVIVEVAACGICGLSEADLHEYTDATLTACCPHPQFGEELPITLGHEFSGVIREVGPDCLPKWTVGKRVIVEPLISCMECVYCQTGRRNLCLKAGWMGCFGSGGLCEQILIRQSMLHALPDNVSLEAGAMVEPASVAHHAVKRSKLQPGGSCLVMGAGPIGCLVLKSLSALGAGWIAVSEPSSTRAKTAKRIGAHDVFNPLEDDVVAECRKRTNGQGVDVVFDCAGIEAATKTAIDAVRPQGVILGIATYTVPPRVDLVAMLMKEVAWVTSQAYSDDHQEVLDLLASGKMELESLITARIPLKNVVEDGIMALLDKKEDHIKILVIPSMA